MKEYIIAGLIILFLFGSIGLYTYHNLQDFKKDLDICKSLGYDGVKFVSAYTTEVQCSNFTDLERVKHLGGQQ